MNAPTNLEKLTPKDYASDQELRWCPGCGDYAIIKSVQKALSEIGASKENTVFISGIGCAARFPYYMATYGFHTIHGRAAAIATGVKVTNPDLDVWVVSGDGDSMSIGGNHLLHCIRRNVDLQYLLFNNEIYGLTKGQYSPTSRLGTRSPSTPQGSVDRPVSPSAFALGCGGHFVARAVDTQQKILPGILARAQSYRGTSFIEIFQNCIVYNDDVFGAFTERSVADDAQVHVVHGEPLIFGKDRDRGLRLTPGKLELEVVQVGVDGITEEDILVHDETNRMVAAMLVDMPQPQFPVALGVLYCDPMPVTYDAAINEQVAEAKAKTPVADVNQLLRSGYTWTV